MSIQKERLLGLQLLDKWSNMSPKTFCTYLSVYFSQEFLSHNCLLKLCNFQKSIKLCRYMRKWFSTSSVKLRESLFSLKYDLLIKHFQSFFFPLSLSLPLFMILFIASLTTQVNVISSVLCNKIQSLYS